MKDALAGKVAMITGASRGIGRAIAHKLAAAGCDVAEAVCAGIRTVGRTPARSKETSEILRAWRSSSPNSASTSTVSTSS